MYVCVSIKERKKGVKPFAGFFKDRLVVLHDSYDLMVLKELLFRLSAEAFWVILFEDSWDV